MQPGPGGALLVKQTYRIHGEIETLLTNLRAAMGR